MARASGSYDRHEYRDNKWQSIINDVMVFAVDSTGLSDDLSGSADMNVAGGYRSQLNYAVDQVRQGSVRHMTASLVFGTASLRFPAASAGSVLGLSLYSSNCEISGGALTASVTVDGVQDSNIQLIMTTGSAGAAALVSKDTVPFSASQQLGVVLTSSANYTTNLDHHISGSWQAALFTEM